MGSVKSVGLSERYKNYRKKRIIYMRDMEKPPREWRVIAKLFGITTGAVQYIYNKAKDEQKEKEKEQA